VGLNRDSIKDSRTSWSAYRISVFKPNTITSGDFELIDNFSGLNSSDEVYTRMNEIIQNEYKEGLSVREGLRLLNKALKEAEKMDMGTKGPFNFLVCNRNQLVYIGHQTFPQKSPELKEPTFSDELLETCQEYGSKVKVSELSPLLCKYMFI